MEGRKEGMKEGRKEGRRAPRYVQKILSMEAKMGMYEVTVEPTLLYGSEVLMLNMKKKDRWKL